MPDSRYSLATYGLTLYGEEPAGEYQGGEALAKPDTVLLIKGGDYTTDDSQIGATMTTDTGMAYTSDVRVAVSGWTIEALVSADNTSVGLLCWVGDDSDATVYQLLIASGGILRLTYDGDGTDVALPGADGTVRDYAVFASVEPAVGGGVIKTVAACLVADPDAPANWAITRETDTAPTPTLDKIAVGGHHISATAGGVYDTTSTGELDTLRYSIRPHSTAEFRYDFIDAAPAISLVGEVPEQLPRWDDVIGDEGQFAGPAYLMAGAHHRARRLCMVGPAWTMMDGGGAAATIDLSAADLGCPSVAWLYNEREAVPGTVYTSHLGLMATPPAPSWATHVKARVLVDVTSATAGEGDSVSVGFFVADQMPGAGASMHGFALPSPERRMYFDAADLDVENTGKAWVEFEPVRLSTDSTGHTYLWVGVADPDEHTPSLVIRSIEAIYVRDEPADTPPAGALIAP